MSHLVDAPGRSQMPDCGMQHAPARSFIIWFSQRTGSTLLASGLAATGVAGKPGEWLNQGDPAELTPAALQAIWQEGTTSNGVFGLKYGPSRDTFLAWTGAFRRVLELPDDLPVPQVWAATFPNCRHVFMTRRNKVRLAASWWRAIQSGEWHRLHGEAPLPVDLEAAYLFGAIDHLFAEASLREASIGEFFVEAGVIPLTLVYEDFIGEYAGTVHRVLDFLNLDSQGVTLPPPTYDRLADALTERWVERFRQERQAGWANPAW